MIYKRELKTTWNLWDGKVKWSLAMVDQQDSPSLDCNWVKPKAVSRQYNWNTAVQVYALAKGNTVHFSLFLEPAHPCKVSKGSTTITTGSKLLRSNISLRKAPLWPHSLLMVYQSHTSFCLDPTSSYVLYVFSPWEVTGAVSQTSSVQGAKDG